MLKVPDYFKHPSLTSHGSTLYVYRNAKSDEGPARGDGPIRTAGYNGA